MLTLYNWLISSDPIHTHYDNEVEWDPMMLTSYIICTRGFPVFFPQLQGKCQGITRKEGARPVLLPN
jgi:hypothetical protein